MWVGFVAEDGVLAVNSLHCVGGVDEGESRCRKNASRRDCDNSIVAGGRDGE